MSIAQMNLHWDLLGDLVEHVLSCLDAQYLGRMEIACKRITGEVTGRCWETLAEIERDDFESRPWLLQIPLEEDIRGKEALKEIFELRVRLNTVPAKWSPQITANSASSLLLLPATLRGDAILAEDTLALPPVPPCAAVLLASGATVGEELAVGVQIQSKAGCANDGVWLGLEFIGVHDGWGKCMSVRCAPLTGRCMLKFPDADTLISQAMPPLDDCLCEFVEIYVVVSPSGDVEFIRYCKAAKSLVRSGRIPHTVLPSWTTDCSTENSSTEMFAAIEVQMADVYSETQVTTKSPSLGLLQEVQNQPGNEFGLKWQSIDS
jgi:hypothetical protein